MSLSLSRFFVVFAAVLSVGGAATAEDKATVATLTKIPLFAFGGIGYAGTTSHGEIAFKSVFASAAAAADFSRILQKGTPEAQCYALVGLRWKDRPQFDEQVNRFAGSKQAVQTCAGCMMAKMPMSSVVANIQRGNFDDGAKASLRPR